MHQYTAGQKRTTNELRRYHPRVVPVFLPTRSPELNLIEDGCGYREK